MNASSNDKVMQAMREIGRLCAALPMLRKEVPHLDGPQFKLLAEGPLTEIRELQAQIDAYLWEDEIALFIRLEGPAFERHNSSIGAIASSLDAVRRSFQGVALRLRELREFSKPTLKRAADLRLVTAHPGSLKVGLRLPSIPKRSGQPDMSVVVQAFMAVASWVAGADSGVGLARALPDWPERLEIISEFGRLIPRNQREVESIEIYSPQSEIPATKITAEAREMVDSVLAKGERTTIAATAELVFEAKEVGRVGRIREINLDTSTFLLRERQTGAETTCSYPESLAERVRVLLDTNVIVTGVPALGAPGSKRLLRVLDVRRVDDPSKQLPPRR